MKHLITTTAKVLYSAFLLPGRAVGLIICGIMALLSYPTTAEEYSATVWKLFDTWDEVRLPISLLLWLLFISTLNINL